MKRSYIYVIVILLTITLVSTDYYIGKDLQNVYPLDVNYNTIEDDYVKEAGVVGTFTIVNEQNSLETLDYKYTLKVNGLSGAYRIKHNNNEEFLIFAANGEAELKLKSNDVVTIYDVPVDLTYTIRQETDNKEFTLTTNGQTTNVATGETSDNSTITFKNTSKVAATKDSKNTQKKETKQKDNKASKKDIPNTGETEIKLTLVLIVSLLIIVCFKIMKVKRFE